MDGNLTLAPDFKEFIESLNANNARYLVVGGYAEAFHGHLRYTKDLDIWMCLDPHHAARTAQALQDFGFGSLGLVASDFLIPDQVIQLGYPPNRIDLSSTLEGVDFETCYASRVTVDIENLKKNKTATGRLQYLADLENLE